MHVSKSMSVFGEGFCRFFFWLHLCRENFGKKLRMLFKQTGAALPALNSEECISISVKDCTPEKEFEGEMIENCP